MKRRIEEIAGRPEVTTAVTASGGGGHLGASGGATGYVRVPPSAPTIVVTTNQTGVGAAPATGVYTNVPHITHDYSHSYSGKASDRFWVGPSVVPREEWRCTGLRGIRARVRVLNGLYGGPKGAPGLTRVRKGSSRPPGPEP